MKKRKKKDIKKLIIDIIACMAMFIVLVAYAYEEQHGYGIVSNTLCVISVLIAIVDLFLYYTYGDGTRTSVNRFKRSDKYSFEYKDFSELYEDVNKKLQDAGYSIKKEYTINEKEKIYIYMKPITGKILEMWILADLISYTKEKTKKLEGVIEDFYNTEINSEKNNSQKVELKSFSLICTHRYSEELEKIVKETYTGGDLTLTVGLLFSAREIYIASAKELRMIDNGDYSSLKEEFFKIVEATPISKNKK